MVVHGALAAWFGQYVGSSDVRCVRDRMLALWRADGVGGQQIRQPRRRRCPATRTIIARACFASSGRFGAFSTSAEASEDASFTHPNFDFLTSKPVLVRAPAAERGRNEGPAAAQPAHGTASAAVPPGQPLIHQLCPETAAGVGRHGATAAARPNVVVHQKKTTTMRTKASPARRC